MLRSICAGVCATLLLPTQNTLASTVFRCEDHNGHITYTLKGCPTDAEQALQSTDNPTPGRGKPGASGQGKPQQEQHPQGRQPGHPSGRSRRNRMAAATASPAASGAMR